MIKQSRFRLLASFLKALVGLEIFPVMVRHVLKVFSTILSKRIQIMQLLDPILCATTAGTLILRMKSFGCRIPLAVNFIKADKA